MARIGDRVTFRPHAEHEHLNAHPELVAIVGQLHAGGTADLFVLVPNKEPIWADGVPEGFGPYTFSDPR